VIEAAGLTKEFRTRRRRSVAVAGIDLSIAAGEFVGYAGPNGAGKSTTVKMLTGILVPTSGTLTVDGLVPSRQRRALAARIGVVFGQRTSLWWDLPLARSFDLVRHLYAVPAADHATLAICWRSASNLKPWRTRLSTNGPLSTLMPNT